MSPKKILILIGPTASGKTEVALEISKLLPCEMISCDSMQVYRGMPILTQAPSSRVLKALKGHLVSFLEPSKEYSAARFRKEAHAHILSALKKERTPLLVGGTGLYLRALLDGLFENEPGRASSSLALRKKFAAQEKKHGHGHLHAELAKIDPAAAAKIHPNDLRRVIRALEVFRLTGKPISTQQPNRRGIRGEFDCRIFMLDRDRADLYERINRRVDGMVEEGLLREIRRLSKRKLSKTASVALGFREMKAHLDGKMSLEEAKELLKKNTRNYAKRQLSWFRHEKGVEPVVVGANEPAKKIAEEIVRRGSLK